jgi:hypothetical protein
LTFFDLLFLLVFFGTLIVLIVAAYFGVRGRLGKAGRLVLSVAAFWAIYLGAVAAVSVSTPRRVVAVAEDRCFDDWCISVERFATEQVSGSRRIAATLRVSSRAKRVRQSAPDNIVYLEDSSGKIYASLPAGDQPSFGTMIGPAESFETIRKFDVPAGARGLGLVVQHGAFPGNIVIGDDNALFHKPAIVSIPEP